MICGTGTGVLACIDIFLANWVQHDTALLYQDLVRISRVCRELRDKANGHKTMVRSLHFPHSLLWLLPRSKRLDVVIECVRQTSNHLQTLDLSPLGALHGEEARHLLGGLTLHLSHRRKMMLLKDLTLPSIAICEQASEFLATMSSLARLDLSRCKVPDSRVARMLEGLPNLRRIACGGDNALSSEGFSALGHAVSRMHALEEVSLSNCGMGAIQGGSEWVFSGLTALQVLKLTNNRNVHSNGRSAQAFGAFVGRMRAMHTLCLVNCRREREDVPAPNELWIGFMATVAAGSVLRRLSIRGNGYNIKGCTALARSLDTMVLLEELDLSDNQIAGAGMQQLVVSLAHKPLKYLNLAENDLGEEGSLSLVAMLPTMTTLETLDLTDNGMEAAAGAVVCSLPATLVSLRLGNNGIDCRCLIAIAEIMHRLPALKALVLENNEIADDGISQFSQIMCEAVERGKTCFHLISLNLIANKIGSRGCSSLFSALIRLPRIVDLRLGENLICEDGCMGIASALGALTGLRELDLGCNRISKEACSTLRLIGRRRGLYLGLDNQAIVDVRSAANFPGIFIAKDFS